MIALNHASRWYGEVIGLNDVTCELTPGITALLGMNGAGKSTMMKLITGQLKPTTGEVLVEGQSPFANPEVYRLLGYCPEIDNFYEHMSGRQFVELMGRLAGYSAAESRKRSAEMIDRVGMADRCDKKIAGYSKGMRQRIKLAQAMVHEPNAILLDEPLNGLDPVGRREFMLLLKSLADAGKTIMVSSHILFEVEQITRNILLLHRGRLLASGDLRVIRELIDTHPHRIRIETPEPREVARHISALPYVLSLRFEPNGQALELQTTQADQFYTALPEIALEFNLPIRGFSSPDNNLESVFRYLVEA